MSKLTFFSTTLFFFEFQYELAGLELAAADELINDEQ